MKWVVGARVVMALVVAALMPLQLGHCVLMPMQASTAAVASEHHDDGDQDCCPEAAPDHTPSSGSDPLCCGDIQHSVATTPATTAVDAPTSALTLFAVVASVASADEAHDTGEPVSPAAHSGSPPEPSTAPQSPRSPPYSA